MSNDLDETRHFSIHEYEFSRLPKHIQKAFLEYENIDYYKGRMPKNRVAKVKDLIRDYVIEIKKHNGKESNTECIAIDLIKYMLDHMMAHEIRKLHLDKLLKK